MKDKILVYAFVVAVIIVGAVFVNAHIQQKQPLTFVFTPGPGTDLAVIQEQFGDIVAELGEYLGVETRIVATTSAAATTEALRNGTADIGRYGPFGYVVAVDEVGAVPVVRERVIDQGDFYFGYIIGKPGMWSDPFAVEQLKGKTVAFVEPSSTSGYLFGVTMMKEAGMVLDDLDSYYFVGSHPAVIEAVINGSVDAGFTCDRRLNIAIDEGVAVEGENYELLLVSPKIMLNPWAARPDLDISMQKLRDAFMSVSPEAMEKAGVERFIVALDSDYDFVRDMAENQ